MNRPEVTERATQIDLAAEPDFAIGPILVSPSLREIRSGDRRETVEPRVMQVLIALVRAEGAVVSRDTLIERCWGGRIVGDDAINRCIAKVRSLAEFPGTPSFEITTVPRVGYRLSTLNAGTAIAAGARFSETASVPRHRVLWVATAIGLLGVAIGAAAHFIFPRAAPYRQWSVVLSDVPIATALIERHAAISPDGAMIAYSAGTNIVTRKIYLHPISGGEALRLTDDAFDDTSPAWSPDGTEIAYVGYQDNQPCHIMIVSIPAGTPREIARCQTDQRTQLAWVPNANALYFTDTPASSGPQRVMRFDIDTGARTSMDHPPKTSLGEGDFAASPDGRWFSFDRATSDTQRERIVLDLRDGHERLLVRYSGSTGATWSEDSRTLFVARATSRDYALWAYASAEGEPERVMSSPQLISRPVTGPHGLLALELNATVSGLARVSPLNPAEPELLAPEKGLDHSPDIAGDGAIVFTAERAGGAGLYVLRRHRPLQKLLDLPVDVAQAAEPRWSPDERYIAFTSDGASLTGVRILTADAREVASIPFHGRAITSLAWSADGKSVIFSGSEDGRIWRLWRIDLARPRTMIALPYTGWRYIRALGDALYGMRPEKPGIWRIDSTPKRITSLPGVETVNNWTVTKDGIAYLVNPLAEHRQIMLQPLTGGPPILLAEAPHYSYWDSFAIDPTDGSIVYANVRGHDSDIEVLHLVQK